MAKPEPQDTESADIIDRVAPDQSVPVVQVLPNWLDALELLKPESRTAKLGQVGNSPSNCAFNAQLCMQVIFPWSIALGFEPTRRPMQEVTARAASAIDAR